MRTGEPSRETVTKGIQILGFLFSVDRATCTYTSVTYALVLSQLVANARRSTKNLILSHLASYRPLLTCPKTIRVRAAIRDESTLRDKQWTILREYITFRGTKTNVSGISLRTWGFFLGFCELAKISALLTWRGTSTMLLFQSPILYYLHLSQAVAEVVSDRVF